jgi:hypothetical protein
MLARAQIPNLHTHTLARVQSRAPRCAIERTPIVHPCVHERTITHCASLYASAIERTRLEASRDPF